MAGKCSPVATALTISKPDTPIAGTSSPSASPRAAATEMRMPVKFPGPTPTPIRSRSDQVTPASDRISSNRGIRRSAWPRPISSAREASTCPPDNKAAAQCAADVSNPRTTGSDANGAHLGRLRDIVAQQVLDPHLQGDGRGRAAGTGALHMQVDNAALEPVKGDVAAILRHGRPHPGIQQFLD